MGKNIKWKGTLVPLALLAALYYGLPGVLTAVADEAMMIFVIALMLLNPAACLACSLVTSWRHGVNWWFPAIAAALFVPAIFVFYNPTAFAYVPAYFVCGCVGEGIGMLAQRRKA